MLRVSAEVKSQQLLRVFKGARRLCDVVEITTAWPGQWMMKTGNEGNLARWTDQSENGRRETFAAP